MILKKRKKPEIKRLTESREHKLHVPSISDIENQVKMIDLTKDNLVIISNFKPLVIENEPS